MIMLNLRRPLPDLPVLRFKCRMLNLRWSIPVVGNVTRQLETVFSPSFVCSEGNTPSRDFSLRINPWLRIWFSFFLWCRRDSVLLYVYFYAFVVCPCVSWIEPPWFNLRMPMQWLEIASACLDSLTVLAPGAYVLSAWLAPPSASCMSWEPSSRPRPIFFLLFP